MAQNLANWFAEHLQVPAEWLVFIVSLFPILELRGGIIAAAIVNLPMWKAILISLAGNALPIPFILLFIIKIMQWMKKIKLFRPLIIWVEKKAAKHSGVINKYGVWGLVLFVGIPLPGTGAWTGALIAALLKINLKKSFFAIGLGLLLATIIMTFICYYIPSLIVK
ncbi:transporter [Clostridia bacterium]|nr:transporter [Clostridia bacterium]